MLDAIRRSLFISCLYIGVSQAAIFADPDFQQEAISRPDGASWSGVVGLQFNPEGDRTYVWERGGRVWIIDDAQPVDRPMLDISGEVLAWRDHGLLGFTLDPSFNDNGYLYLSYIVDRHHLEHCVEPASGVGAPICDAGYDPNLTLSQVTATIGRIVRYTAIKPAGSEDFAKATEVNYQSRKVLVGETPQSGFPMMHETHGSGQLVFGTDGSLLAAFGDGASFRGRDVGSAPESGYLQALDDGIITSSENVGAFRSQMLSSLNGKIIRIDPGSGDGYPSNPYYQAGAPRSAESRTWALGLRNPYRMVLQPGTGSHNVADGDPGTLYLGDVGNVEWEELNIVDGPGLNFGWPVYEGMGFEWGFRNVAPVSPEASALLGCDVLFIDMVAEQSLSPLSLANPCGGTALTGFPAFEHARPALTWFHGDEITYTPQFDLQGNALALRLGNALPGTATVPATGAEFPGNASTGGVWYQGTDFPDDYRNTYFHGDYGGQWIRNVRLDGQGRVTEVRPFIDDAGGVVFMATHPSDGHLYYVSWASVLYRVTYAPGGNRPPSAALSASRQFGPSPLLVQFSADGSSDPEQRPLNFFWDFGDGSSSNAATPLHEFVANSDEPQSFTVTLTVNDTGTPSQSDSATTLISLNNTPPQVTITSPANNGLYPLDGNTTYPLRANITDNEHSPSQLSCAWQLELFHNNHTHQDPVDTNCETQAQISPVGCDGEEYHYQISLTVTDQEGLSGTDVVRLYPDCGDSQRPLAQDDRFDIQLGQRRLLAVLDNDQNLPPSENLQLSLLSSPTRGQLELINNSEIWYQPNGNLEGTDSFRYQLSGPGGSTQATVTLLLHNDGNLAKLAPVQLSPLGGEFEQAIEVTASHPDAQAEIRISTDGSDPTMDSLPYSTPIDITTSTQLQARAYRQGWLPSDITSERYQYPLLLPPSLQQGLIGYWPLDDGQGAQARDQASGQNHGSIAGASWTDGWSGAGLQFDGIDDQVTISDQLLFRFGADDNFSLTAWAKPQGPQGGWSGLVTKAREERNWYGLWISASDRWVFGGPSNLNGPVLSNDWQHLSLVQDRSGRTLYVNGVAVASGAIQTGDDAGDLIFGGARSVNEYYQGTLDEIRLYNRPLSADEIRALATADPAGGGGGGGGGGGDPTVTTQNDSASVLSGSSIDIDVLANDSADQGLAPASLSIVAPPQLGSIELIDPQTGVVRYQANNGSSGTDSFTYQVEDTVGTLSSPATVMVTIQPGSGGGVDDIPGLLGYWPLDGGSANDASGNGNDGVISGAQTDTGRWEQSLRFDGIDDRVIIPHRPEHSFSASDSYSLSAWVRADGPQGGWSGVVTKGRELGDWYGIWISADDRWVFGGSNNVTGPSIDTAWHHLLLVQNGSNNSRVLYLDGQAVASGATVASDNTGEIVFGAAKGVTEFFRGNLDEVRLYGRALTDSEIATLASGAPGDGGGGGGGPVTNPDNASLLVGETVVIDVLANDSATSGLDPASVIILTPPSLGTIEQIDTQTGTITYRHEGTVAGNDAFSYQVSDIAGAVSVATQVSIVITEPSTGELVPLAYWPLDGGSAIDTTGNGFDGTISGAITGAGRYNGGMWFDGIDDRITIAHDPLLSFSATDSFSLSLWVQAQTGPTGWRGIVTKSRDDRPWYGLWISPTNRLVFGGSSSNGDGGAFDTSWQHIVLVQDGSSQIRRMYVNGVQTLETPSADGTGTGDLVFGAANGVAEYFKGQLDEIRLYRDALDDDQIRSLMQLDPGSGEEQVVANDDVAQVASLGSVTLDLLGNDSATRGFDLSSWQLVAAPQYGTVTFDDQSGLASYRHQGPDSVDTFSYQIKGTGGTQSNVATVRINVMAPTPPSISLSTAASEIASGKPLEVFWQLRGDQTAFDHLHLSLDGLPHVALHDYSSGSYDFGPQAAGTHTIRAWLVDGSHQPVEGDESDVTISVFVYDPPAAVAISPAPGTYSDPISVQLTNTDGSDVHYTLDGSIPDALSARYVQPLVIERSTTVKAVSVDTAGRVGDVSTADYVIEGETSLPTLGLKGYWPLDAISSGNQLLDQSGQAHHGTNSNAIAVQGLFNGALYFNGDDARVIVPHSADFAFAADDSFTLSLWAKLDGNQSGWAGLVTKSRDVAPWYGMWVSSWDTWIFGGPTNLEGGRIDQQWHHFLLRQNGPAGIREFYLDGRLISSRGSLPADGNGALWFGAAAAVDEAFAGTLDEIRLYDRALSSQEIEALSSRP